MKKVLSVLLASATALSVCGGLAACGEDTSNTLRVWAPAAAKSCYQKLADEWKAENPQYKDWTVKVDPYEESDVQDKLPAKLSTGPNVYFFPSDHLYGMAKKGALQPLTGTEYEADVKANNDAGSVAGATLSDGKLYAFPATSDNGIMLYYRKDYFKGVDMTSLDAIQAKVRNDNNNPSIMLSVGSGFYATSFFLGAGINFNYTSDDLTGYETDLDSPLGAAVSRAYYDYFNPALTVNGNGESASVIVDGNTDTELASGLKSGAFVAGFAGTWVYKEVEKQISQILDEDEEVEDILGITTLPKFKYTLNGTEHTEYMGSFAGSKYCGVNGMVESKEKITASLSLANYFTSYKGQMARFNATVSGPSNKQAANENNVKTHPAIKAFQAQKALKSVAQKDQPTTFWSITVVTNIMNGTIDSAEKAVTAFKEWAADLSE